MKKVLFLVVLASALLPGSLLAQTLVTVNGMPPIALDATGGLYFHNDTLTVTGSDQSLTLSLDEVEVLVFNIQQTSLSAPDSEAPLTIYPTPAQSSIVLRGVGDSPQQATLYNIQGVKLLCKTVSEGDKIELNTLPTGEYLLKCGNRTVKFIKL